MKLTITCLLMFRLQLVLLHPHPAFLTFPEVPLLAPPREHGGAVSGLKERCSGGRCFRMLATSCMEIGRRKLPLSWVHPT